MRSIFVMWAFVGGVCAATVQPFALQQMNAEAAGAVYASSDHPNAVFVIENYFLACPYCNENAANVGELVKHYEGNSRVQILDVGIDREPSQYAEWIRRHNPNHPVLHDGKRLLTRQLGTTHYPTAYVVDSSGEILLKTTGVWSHSTQTRIRAVIDEALLQSGDSPLVGNVPIH